MEKNKIINDSDKLNHLVKYKHGYILFNKLDRYIGQAIKYYGEFSEGEYRVFANFCSKGDYVIDAGANIGYHTLSLAQLVGKVGKVFSFEPQRILFQILNANVALNSMINVHAYDYGLGVENTYTYIYDNVDYSKATNPGSISLECLMANKEENKSNLRKTKIVSLDNFYDEPRLKFIKIDVEGMEKDVLLGAKNTIKKYRPILYVENDRRDKSKELIELIQSYDYRLYWHVVPLVNFKDNYANNTNNVWNGIFASLNMLCFHRANKITTNLQEIKDSSAPYPV